MSDPLRFQRTIIRRLGAIVLSLAISGPAYAQQSGPPADDLRPLSPAQIELFETPHLRNLDRVSTLNYSYVREGAVPVSDTVSVHIRRVNGDGSKDLSFDYLTGDRTLKFPELDHFRGNPLIMLTLERDVAEMKDQVGLSTSYFRNKIRESFVGHATITDANFVLNGTTVPAREITVRPFEGDQRLSRIPSLQAKTYAFVVADAVPGMIAEIRIAVPADGAMAAPAFNQRTSFVGVGP